MRPLPRTPSSNIARKHAQILRRKRLAWPLYNGLSVCLTWCLQEDGPLRKPPLRIVPFTEKVCSINRALAIQFHFDARVVSDTFAKPAVLEERRGDIEFRVVNNDGSHDSFIVLTGLKCIFQKQLPKMPKDYIARLVYDRSHLSIAIVKHPLEVVGYVTATRPLPKQTLMAATEGSRIGRLIAASLLRLSSVQFLPTSR